MAFANVMVGGRAMPAMKDQSRGYSSGGTIRARFFVLKMQWTRFATKESGMGGTIACQPSLRDWMFILDLFPFPGIPLRYMPG